MDDDFNTPLAVAALFDLVTELNKSKSPVLARQLKELAAVIGLLQRTAQQFRQAAVGDAGGDDGAIEAAIVQRAEAKKARNFAESDKIRADLLAQGVILEDKPDGTTNWRRA
jgi:cysteinyl-tRNA synthetase